MEAGAHEAQLGRVEDAAATLGLGLLRQFRHGDGLRKQNERAFVFYAEAPAPRQPAACGPKTLWLTPRFAAQG